MKKIILGFFFVVLSLFTVKVYAKDTNVYVGKGFEILDVEEQGQEMIRANFSEEFLVERKDNLNYLHFKLLNHTNISNLVYKVDGKVIGNVTYLSDDFKDKTYILTLSDENKTKKISVEGYVVPMKSTVTFGIKFNLKNLTEASKDLLDFVKAPEFVPEIKINGEKEYSLKTQEEFTVPLAKGTLGTKSLDVKYRIYEQTVLEGVTLNGGKVVFSKPGLYVLEYLCKTSEYKFSDGSNSFTKENVLLNVTSLDMFNTLKDSEGTGVYLIDHRFSIKSGVKLKVEVLTKKEAPLITKNFPKQKRFEYYDVGLQNLQEEVSLNSTVELYLPVKSTFSLNKTKVYFYDGDKFTEVKGNYNHGYFKISTKALGKFLVLEENTNKHLGLIIGLTTGIVILGGLIAFGIVFFKKRNKKSQN